MRRSPIRLRSVKATRRADRWRVLRRDVFARDQGRCVLTGVMLDPLRFEAHHRLLKSQGGRDTAVNVITLDPRAHKEFVHAFPQWAYSNGFLVPAWADPADWPVNVHAWSVREPRWLLPGEGRWMPAVPHPDQGGCIHPLLLGRPA